MNEDYNKQLIKKLRYETREQAIPLSGAFELTPRCTLDCAMCYVHLTKQQMGDRSELSTNDWLGIIDSAYNEGMLFALLTGGECTLHDGFIPIYRHLKELGCIVTINTNGTILTDDILNMFRSSPPRCIQISLYGSNEDNYEKVTGKRSYHKVLENLFRLKDAKLPIRVAVTPNRYLQDDAVEIVRFCRENGIKCIVNKTLIEAHYDTGRSMTDYSMTVEEEIALRRRLLPNQPESVVDYSNLTIPEVSIDSPPLYTAQCAAGKSTFAINWEGKMRPCLSDDSFEVPVNLNGFSNAWRELYAFAQNNLQPIECETCAMRKACFDCYITRMDPNNPGHRNAGTCEITIKRIQAGISQM